MELQVVPDFSVTKPPRRQWRGNRVAHAPVVIACLVGLGIALTGEAVQAQGSARTNLVLDVAKLGTLATWPSGRTRTPDGELLRLGPGRVDHEILLRLPLAGLIPFSTTNVGFLSVTAEVGALTSDNDPILLLTDGRGGIGVMRLDNDGGSLWPIVATNILANRIVLGPDLPALRAGWGQHATWRTDFIVFPSRSNWIEVGARMGAARGHFVPTQPLGQDGPYELLLVANNAVETYALRNITLQYSSAAPVADSEVDFGSTQAANGWEYGYFDATVAPDAPYDPIRGFQRLENYDRFKWNEWYLLGGTDAASVAGWYTSIRRRDMIPHQISTSRPEEHWVIRRWTVPATGNYLITGVVAKRSGATTGDGVRTMVMVGGFPAYERTLNAGDTAGTAFALELGLSAEAVLDFAVAPNGNITADWTDFSVAIGRMDLPSLLPPGAITLRRAYEVVIPTQANRRYFLQTASQITGSASDWSPLARDVPSADWIPGDGFEQRRFMPEAGQEFYRVGEAD